MVRARHVGERDDRAQAMVSAGLGMTVMPEFLPILPEIEARGRAALAASGSGREDGPLICLGEGGPESPAAAQLSA